MAGPEAEQATTFSIFGLEMSFNYTSGGGSHVRIPESLKGLTIENSGYTDFFSGFKDGLLGVLVGSLLNRSQQFNVQRAVKFGEPGLLLYRPRGEFSLKATLFSDPLELNKNSYNYPLGWKTESSLIGVNGSNATIDFFAWLNNGDLTLSATYYAVKQGENAERKPKLYLATITGTETAPKAYEFKGRAKLIGIKDPEAYQKGIDSLVLAARNLANPFNGGLGGL